MGQEGGCSPARRDGFLFVYSCDLGPILGPSMESQRGSHLEQLFWYIFNVFGWVGSFCLLIALIPIWLWFGKFLGASSIVNDFTFYAYHLYGMIADSPEISILDLSFDAW